MERKTRRIETVHLGNATVKIYKRFRTVHGNSYPTFEVADFVSIPGRRKMRMFADHQAAVKEATRICRLLATGDALAAAMSGKEAAAFGRCLELLRPVGDAPELACARYAKAASVLGSGDLLEAAARFYVEGHPTTLPQVTLAQAADEMIELKRKNKASEPYIADLRCRTGGFVKALQVHPASVNTADVQKYLDNLDGASSTKNATRRVLWRLFAHCESRGYIPKRSNPVADTQAFNGTREEPIAIWTPHEMTKLLSAAIAHFVPVLCLGGFAGLRTSEILALNWMDICLPERTIKVTHRKLRCAGTRLAPITDNLLAWLTPLAKKSGSVWPIVGNWRERARSISDAQKETAERAGFPSWRHNALRHSFITYRVAATQDVSKTALEAGNSPKTVFSNYRALATAKEATVWFSIMPDERAVKDVDLRDAAAG